VTKKFRYPRGQDFSPLPRRERRAYPPAVCKERATPAAAKKTATRRAAPDLTSGFVAPQSQSADGYVPSSRLARGQIRRGAGIAISLSQYWFVCPICARGSTGDCPATAAGRFGPKRLLKRVVHFQYDACRGLNIHGKAAFAARLTCVPGLLASLFRQ